MSDHSGPETKIAIVGRAGRFPAARDVREFWRMLDQGRLATTRLTDEALLKSGVSRAALADPAYVRAANILPDMEAFDAPFFGFSPKEAAILDPQHRQFLEVLGGAGERRPHARSGSRARIGVFAGCGMGRLFLLQPLLEPRAGRSDGHVPAAPHRQRQGFPADAGVAICSI